MLAKPTGAVRADYPRPDFDRSSRWLSLNGTWSFAADANDDGRAEGWNAGHPRRPAQEIVVPFPWESPASGIAEEGLEVGWYWRTLARPGDWPAQQRTILHFGAVHHRAEVWVNSVPAGAHEGGSLPFWIDLTDMLDGRGAAELVVRVEAPLDKGAIPHGKQRSVPPDVYDSCAFTASSGIWQSVWLESRPATYVADAEIRPAEALDAFDVRVALAGPALDSALLLLEVDGTRVELQAAGRAEHRVRLAIDEPRLWRPDDPHLYTVAVRLASRDGEDVVAIPTGLRRIERRAERLFLNGERLYVRGVLDQGFWPGCGHTAPSDDALRRDIELARAAGYNLVRKHIKLEDPRWLHWADRLGMLVWAEPPCTSRWSPSAAAAFNSQIEPMVARDGNHPSIVIWGLYNEEWGLDWDVAGDPAKQAAVREARGLLSAADSSRPAVDNSGWSHVDTDLVDWHYYAETPADWRDVVAGLASGGRDGFPVNLGPQHVQTMRLGVPGADLRGLPLLNSEYGGGAFDEERRAWHMRWQTQELRRHDRMQGYVYTELCDIEYELCGVYDEQRQPKSLAAVAADVNAETVLVVDLLPERPGADLVTPDGAIDLRVAVSHHGCEPLEGRLVWNWDHDGDDGSTPASARPFELGADVAVTAALPEGAETARLHLRLEDAETRVRARTMVDVARA